MQIKGRRPHARTLACLVFILLISSDNRKAAVGPTLSYQISPTPVGSEILSAAASEVELGTQEPPHFVRVKDKCHSSGVGGTPFILKAEFYL